MFKKRHLPFTSERDERIKFLTERITKTEKKLDELCCNFAGFSRKLARFRDKNDELAKTFHTYSDEEEIHQSLSTGMKSLSKALTVIADLIDLEVHRIEAKIINELGQYDNICKNTKENLRTTVAVRDKEVARRNQLIDLKSKFSANSSAADSEILKAKLEVSRTNKQIDEVIDNFEKRKLHDIKNIMLDFILIQIKQHAKSIEILSAVYYDVSNINEKQDLQNFKKLTRDKLNEKENQLKNEISYHCSQSQSMEHLGKILQSTHSTTQYERLSKSTKDLASTITEDEEEEDTDDSDIDSDGNNKEVTSDDSTEESQSEIDFIGSQELVTSNRSNSQQSPKLQNLRKGIPQQSLSSTSPKTRSFTATTSSMLSGGNSTAPNNNQSLMTIKSINGVTKYQPINYSIGGTKNK